MQTTNEAATVSFTTHAAAKYLGLSASWLNKSRVYGTGPAYCKLGGRVVYLKADLDNWIAANKRQSTSGERVAVVAAATGS